MSGGTTREAVAEALYRAERNASVGAWLQIPESMRNIYRHQADAAIQAYLDALHNSPDGQWLKDFFTKLEEQP